MSCCCCRLALLLLLCAPRMPAPAPHHQPVSLPTHHVGKCGAASCIPGTAGRRKTVRQALGAGRHEVQGTPEGTPMPEHARALGGRQPCWPCSLERPPFLTLAAVAIVLVVPKLYRQLDHDPHPDGDLRQCKLIRKKCKCDQNGSVWRPPAVPLPNPGPGSPGTNAGHRNKGK